MFNVDKSTIAKIALPPIMLILAAMVPLSADVANSAHETALRGQLEVVAADVKTDHYYNTNYSGWGTPKEAYKIPTVSEMKIHEGFREDSIQIKGDVDYFCVTGAADQVIGNSNLSVVVENMGETEFKECKLP